MTFGQKCKKYRLLAGLTQQEKAKAAQISRRTYIYYETDEKFPRKRDTITSLAEVFEIEPDSLMPEDDEYILEMQRNLPEEEKISHVLSEIKELLSDEDIDDSSKTDLISALSALCSEYSLALHPETDDTIIPQQI